MTGLLIAAILLMIWVVGRLVDRRRPAGPRQMPQPGEIWWARVPFREIRGEKIRPSLVLWGDGQTFHVLKITSQDRSNRHDHMVIPTRHWNPRATHDSFLDLSAPFVLGLRDLKNRAGVVDPATWQRVAQLHPIGPPIPQPVYVPHPQPERQPRESHNYAVTSTIAIWARILSFLGLFTCGLTAPLGAILGHVARADIRRTGKWGDHHAIKAIAVGWILTAVMGLGWFCWGGQILPYTGIGRSDASTVPLHRLPSSYTGDGRSGARIDSVLAGTSYPAAVGLWVGCGSTPATLDYPLGAGYTRLTATVGLDATAPAGLSVIVKVLLDGGVLATATVTRTTAAPLDVPLTGGRTLRITAQRTAGACTASARPYAALGAAQLLR